MLLVFPNVQGKQEMTASLGKLKGSTFERAHVDLDLTPAQAALRRAKQPDFQNFQRQGKQPRWREPEIICRATPKRPAPAHALLLHLPLHPLHLQLHLPPHLRLHLHLPPWQMLWRP